MDRPHDNLADAKPPHVPRYYPLAPVLAALALGIVVDRYRPLPLPIWWLLGALSLAAWLIYWRARPKSPAAVWLLMMALAALGGARHQLSWNLFRADELGLAAPEKAQPICLEAIVDRGPRTVPAPPKDPLRGPPQQESTRLRISIVAVRAGETWQAASGRALVFVAGSLDGVEAGDRVRLFAHFSTPGGPQNPGDYDFAARARAENQLTVLNLKSPACLQVIQAGSWWNLARILDAARRQADDVLRQRLSRREARFASAVLLGEREQIGGEETETLLASGTIRILSISGMHVGVLVFCLMQLIRLGLRPRWLGLTFIALLALTYALLTDAHPATLRATLLVFVVCGALGWRRRGLAFNSLALAAIGLLLLNPNDLFGVGCQLSFLSVAALAWFATIQADRPLPDPLDKLIATTRPWPVRLGRRAATYAGRMLLLSLCISLVSAPLVAARFHLFTPAAIVFNLLLIAPMTLALAAGGGLLIFGGLCPPLANVFAWWCDAGLRGVEQIVAWADQTPGGHWWTAGPSDWWLVGFYALLAMLALSPRCTLGGRKWSPPPRWRWALLIAWGAVGLAVPLVRAARSERLECEFVSVGHGLAVVLHLPDGRTLLYDAGRMGSPPGGAGAIADALWSRGISHIDAIVLSHADTDHYNAVPGLAKRFSIGAVYVSPIMFRDRTAALGVLHDAIVSAGIPLREISSGDRLATGAGCQIEVLHPPAAGVVGSDLDKHNANCIVLAVDYAGRRTLLTGDLEGTGLRNLLAEMPCHCDVLLAPHHGSPRSDPAGLAAWSTPNWVVISNAPAFQTDKAVAAYRAVGAQVFNTAECGAIDVTIDSHGIDLQTFRPAPR